MLKCLANPTALLTQHQFPITQCFWLQCWQLTPTMAWRNHKYEFIVSKHIYFQPCRKGRCFSLNQPKIQTPVQGLFNDLMRIEDGNIQAHLRIAGAKTCYDRRKEIDAVRGTGCQCDFSYFNVLQCR